ncbi:MAG: ribosomal L7Ae/L30e/S12e/Gadd45 family protein [Firmicutes bacterium]|nr:ribosomal L7Ae/L30e/S12e/Gadd45 family protein [Bacillota bacterium]
MIKNNTVKVLSMLGMSYQAKKIITGEDALRKSIRENKVKLLIIANDASDNTKKRLINCAKHYGISYYVFSTKNDFSICLGGKNRSAIGIIDKNFTNIVEKLICNVLQSKTGGE